MNARRLWGLSEAGLGTLGLVAPELLAGACAGKERLPPTWLIRLLGGRVVGQGCLLLIHPTDEVIDLGTSLDALHGISMMLVAIVSPNHRRTALTAAALAAVCVAIGMNVKSV